MLWLHTRSQTRPLRPAIACSFSSTIDSPRAREQDSAWISVEVGPVGSRPAIAAATDRYARREHPGGNLFVALYTVRTTRGRQHYLGWSANPVERLRRHRSGYGAAETRRASADGAKLIMTQTWRGTPALERMLKDWSQSRRVGFVGLCPMCEGGVPLPPLLRRRWGRDP